MSKVKKAVHLLGRAVATAFVFAIVAIAAWGQDTTTTTIKHGEKSYETQVKNAEVVYVEGNDLVLKFENGKIEHLVAPDSDTFTIDGKDVTVHELVAGTKLTQTITTTTAPRYVSSVRVLKGKVWHVNPPRYVVVTLPDGKNQEYMVPSHAKFIIGGKPKTVFELRKGMMFEATIVTDDTHTVVEQTKQVVGQAPPATPVELGVLLVLRPQLAPQPAEPVATLAGADEPLAASLPKTATPLPLLG